MDIGERIKDILKQRGMTVQGLSELSGVSANTIYATTKKDGAKTMRMDTLNKIADALDVSVDYLMTGEEGKKEPAVNKNSITDLGIDIATVRKLNELEKKLETNEVTQEDALEANALVKKLNTDMQNKLDEVSREMLKLQALLEDLSPQYDNGLGELTEKDKREIKNFVSFKIAQREKDKEE